MIRLSTILLLLIIAGVFACINSQNTDNDKNDNIPAINAVKPVNPGKRLEEADSLIVLFYKNPFGEDSLRYTRYYKQSITTDSIYIRSLIENVRQPFEKLEHLKRCRSEGKIWCYNRGQIFQTVYFNTRCEGDCCFIYIIKDGFFYYYSLTDAFLKKLSKLKKVSTNVK